MGLSGLAAISFNAMRSAMRASRMPRPSQISWVILKVKMRCSRSGSRWTDLTSVILSFDILTFFLIRGPDLTRGGPASLTSHVACYRQFLEKGALLYPFSQLTVN